MLNGYLKIWRNLEMKKINLADSQLEEVCRDIRGDMFKLIKRAKSGHLGGSSSSTEIKKI